VPGADIGRGADQGDGTGGGTHEDTRKLVIRQVYTAVQNTHVAARQSRHPGLTLQLRISDLAAELHRHPIDAAVGRLRDFLRERLAKRMH
jgi:hypothetical protein